MKGLMDKLFNIVVGLSTWLILFLILFWGQSFVLGTILDINDIFLFSRNTTLFGLHFQERIYLNQVVFGITTLIIMIKFIKIPQFQKKNRKDD